MKKFLIVFIALIGSIFFIALIGSIFANLTQLNASNIWIEAEKFDNKGGWVVDQQFIDQMGSPYLMAHGMGNKVEDATTNIQIETKGKYHIYVRTFNWTAPWTDKEGPGAFKLQINGKTIGSQLGTMGTEWTWQYAGSKRLSTGQNTITLADLTGFNGRCDAIYLSTEKTPPPAEVATLNTFRRNIQSIPDTPKLQKQYDFVVVGGGVAGICAAMGAARQGLKVALINDRPVWGGCNSSEIRVHLGGRIEVTPYKNLGNMIKEFGHTKAGNAKPAANYQDQRKQDFLDSNPNLELYPSTRAVRVIKQGDNIQSVITQHIESGEEIQFNAPLFADCTGDGSVGAYAEADFRMGRESRHEHGETQRLDIAVDGEHGKKWYVEKGSYLAPDTADRRTLGASVQWYSKKGETTSNFPGFNYGVEFNENNFEKVTMGEWTWETGMGYDQIEDAEYIRDYGMMVIYSNWAYLKNQSIYKEDYANRSLEWVAYIAGRRESRRLLGDHILTATDLIDHRTYPDGTASTTWSIDLHYPNPENTKNFPGEEFKSVAKHVRIYQYPVPYRCLYSRNVNNLLMAGRNISVTHIALGTTRVMRTTGMLGEVVGLAASVCHKNRTSPRGVYQNHLDELIELMKIGAGQPDLPNNQKFNTGSHLKTPPTKK